MPQNIPIDKTVFNKSQFELAVDIKFSELFAQNTPITVDQFFVYYNDLFFDIPDNGSSSHRELIERSTDYLGEDLFEVERNTLLDQISTLEKRIIELEAKDPEHPVFANGEFVAVLDAATIYYMDKGLARSILDPGVYKSLVRIKDPSQKSLPDVDVDGSSLIIRLNSEAFNQIPKGKPFTYNDLSGKNDNETSSQLTSLLNKAIDQSTLALKTGVIKSPSQKRSKKEKTESTPQKKLGVKKFITK